MKNRLCKETSVSELNDFNLVVCLCHHFYAGYLKLHT
jgi:hypothetical protein